MDAKSTLRFNMQPFYKRSQKIKNFKKKIKLLAVQSREISWPQPSFVACATQMMFPNP